MKLAKNALPIALLMLAFAITMSAQTTLRSEKDNRNPAPTVGTGGPVGGPTGLFTVYDGQTLRKGEFTFSIAYSNFDRDPGDVDITEVPVSFQIGLSDRLELFFNTDAYKAFKVNSPRNLSGFYLPNAQLNGTSLDAIILAPQGAGASNFSGRAVFRPAGTQPFVQYPFSGGSAGGFGFPNSVSPGLAFGFPVGTNPTLGPPTGSSGTTAANFPGIGSTYGGILPGVVLQTQNVGGTGTVPVIYTLRPAYLPDAPFLSRGYGESSFSTFVVGAKYRFTSVNKSYGLGIIPFYRFYADKANSQSGFNQLQRGASPGGNRGDFGVTFFADARLRNYVNVSGNVGYIYNSSVKGKFPSGTYTLLDRPDELQYGVGVDFPVNKHFQPILEYRGTKYVGGRTPNAFENDPMDGIAGVRIFPKRWYGVGLAYRYNFNQQDRNSISGVTFNQNVFSNAPAVNAQGTIVGVGAGTTRTSTGSLLGAFRTSTDPNGFIVQLFAGHRNERGKPDIVNQPANVTAVDLDKTQVTLPCPAGSTSESCSDNQMVGVRTTAVDPEGDVLTYSYTVSGGRITGQGANVSWDLTGVRPGTYTVTSAVDDGCGFCGQTKTTSITVVDCPNCKAACSCPTINITEPSGITNVGDPVTFTANVTGGSTDSTYTYNWSVSSGTIIEGQGTPVIRVSTVGQEGANITATVNIGGIAGGTACNCNSQATGQGSVGKRPVESVVEEFGVQKPDEIKARLNNFYIALGNDPSARGVIINSGTDKEVAKREAEIRKAIAFLNDDINRVEFRRGSSEPGIKTQFIVVPAGATMPNQ